jgi:YD repeat-containing protein
VKGTLFFLLATLPAWAVAQANEASLLKAQKVTQLRVYAGTRLAATERYDPSGNVLASSDDSFLAETIRHSRAQQFNEENCVLWSKTTHSAMKDTTFWRYHYNERHQLTFVTDEYTGKEVQRLAYDPAGRLARKDLPTTKEAMKQSPPWTEAASTGGSNEPRTTTRTGRSRSNSLTKESFSSPNSRNTGPTGKKARCSTWSPKEPRAWSTGMATTTSFFRGALSPATTVGGGHWGDNTPFFFPRRHFTRDHRREVTTGTEAFTYTPAGLIETFAEDIFSFSHVQRTFSYQYN